MTTALNKCMEVLFIQNMKVLLYNQVYSTKIFIFPAGGEWLVALVCLALHRPACAVDNSSGPRAGALAVSRRGHVVNLGVILHLTSTSYRGLS